MNSSRPVLTWFVVALTLFLTFHTSVCAEDDAESLAAFTEEGMALWQVPGMSVAVVSSDAILFQQGFGQTSLDGGEKVDTHTLFAIASTTKAMVVTGILMLADEGKLSLDDRVIKYLPELRFSRPLLNRELIIRDLLAHRTGLPSTDWWTFLLDMPLDEQISRLEYVDTEALIRTRLIYQNTMFELAGQIIERISGQTWGQFLKERLWQPIGMDETYASRGRIESGKVYVQPHDVRDEEVVVVDWTLPADLANAAGSVWSSIHDMSLWAQFLLRDGVNANGTRLVSENLMSQMFEPHQLASTSDFYPTFQLTRPNWRSYGLGWFQQDFQGRKIDFHTGSLSGLIAIIGLDRANDKAIMVLGNRDHAEMRHALLWEVMDNSKSEEKRDWNQDIFDLYAVNSEQQTERWAAVETRRLKNTSPSLSPPSYAGTYTSPQNGEILITEEESELSVQTPLLTFPLKHWHVDTFLLTHEPWGLREFVRFELSPEGGILSLHLLGDTFERREDSRIPAD